MFVASNPLPEQQVYTTRTDESHQNQTVKPPEPPPPPPKSKIKPIPVPDAG